MCEATLCRPFSQEVFHSEADNTSLCNYVTLLVCLYHYLCTCQYSFFEYLVCGCQPGDAASYFDSSTAG